jgi:hypothetical protein
MVFFGGYCQKAADSGFQGRHDVFDSAGLVTEGVGVQPTGVDNKTLAVGA